MKSKNIVFRVICLFLCSVLFAFLAFGFSWSYEELEANSLPLTNLHYAMFGCGFLFWPLIFCLLVIINLYLSLIFHLRNTKNTCCVFDLRLPSLFSVLQVLLLQLGLKKDKAAECDSAPGSGCVEALEESVRQADEDDVEV